MFVLAKDQQLVDVRYSVFETMVGAFEPVSFVVREIFHLQVVVQASEVPGGLAQFAPNALEITAWLRAVGQPAEHSFDRRAILRFELLEAASTSFAFLVH
ncbi:hypothetical protein ACFQL7_13230 [Halocatena marina]|uniref:Uncharacterized protein n=1 Tax=Halocatena marina TaxID=2934937 RepID=A0ABD5YP83_9EURY